MQAEEFQEQLQNFIDVSRALFCAPFIVVMILAIACLTYAFYPRSHR